MISSALTVFRSASSSSCRVPTSAAKHAAPVDVAAEQHRGGGVEGDAHIDDFGGFEVDFGGAAGAFNDDHIVLAAQGVQRTGLRRPTE